MINYNLIIDTFIEIARDGVGAYLSTMGIAPNIVPSVIRTRQPGTRPDYPYIEVDQLETQKTGSWLLGEGVDESNETFRETQYKLLMQYTIRGGNANSIAQELQNYFISQSVLDKIEVDTTGTLEETFSVISLPEYLSTEYLEVAAFNFTFNITDRLSDPTTGTFSNIILDGELRKNEDDPTPINLDISVP